MVIHEFCIDMRRLLTIAVIFFYVFITTFFRNSGDADSDRDRNSEQDDNARDRDRDSFRYMQYDKRKIRDKVWIVMGLKCTMSQMNNVLNVQCPKCTMSQMYNVTNEQCP